MSDKTTATPTDESTPNTEKGKDKGKKTTAAALAVTLIAPATLLIDQGETIWGVLMLLVSAGLIGLYVYVNEAEKEQPDMPVTAEQIEVITGDVADRIETRLNEQRQTDTPASTTTETNEFQPNAPSESDRQKGE